MSDIVPATVQRVSSNGFVVSLQPSSAVRSHRFHHVVGAKVWVDDAANGHAVHFLGERDGVGHWAVDVNDGDDPSDGAAVELRALHDRVDEVEWAISGRAVQIAEWARTHRFCGRCASPTELSATDRSMRCPACGLLAYPRLAPAMITLVTKGPHGPDQRVLLARGVQFRMAMYSCLAGFVEPGESLEQAVVREVGEEVGVRVADVTYRASQPWPFPHSLMIGFRARWESGDIECDPAEIVDAQWFRRDAMPTIPPPISIARRLIDEWVNEVVR